MKLMDVDANVAAKSLQGFQYSHVEMDKLGATEYTIVGITTDATGSVSSFKSELEAINKVCVESCKKSPRAENLLIRATAFNSPMGVQELHGFTLLSSVDPKVYDGAINPTGGTPLFDATLESVDTLQDYGKKLFDQQHFCNAIIFIITDGDDNSSSRGTPARIKETITKIKKSEIFESLTMILIGVNVQDAGFKAFLDKFNVEAGFDQFVSIEDATPRGLAKLAKFVSQSVSSTSQALGTGGASQPVNISTITI